jgi:multicomponent Na+:H+ antiporter subunit G
VTAAIDALLIVMVLATWLGCAGFARLRGPLDRMHCVTFVAVTAGTALTLAAFLADGVSDRALKILVVTLLCLLSGAVNAHAIGRALLTRGTTEPGAVRDESETTEGG